MAKSRTPLSSKEAVSDRPGVLTNIAKHAKAKAVSVTLIQADGRFELLVVDHGSGFDPNGEVPGHLGLRSMADRAEKCGGLATHR